ncbi:MAG: hypothetical protein HS115_13055 [Spirochaetales bacterium]|nr:hypothetical protein [Spirochaetales bacterium]
MPEESPKPPCLVQLHLERGTLPWQGDEESLEPADLSGASAPPFLADFTTKLGPPLAFTASGPRVHAGIFSRLERVDATRGGPAKAIGSFTREGLAQNSPRNWVLFLLRAEIVQSYAHTESHLCLERERDTPEEYRAQFSGKHIYFTNQRNEAPLRFDLLIGKSSGQILLEGRTR